MENKSDQTIFMKYLSLYWQKIFLFFDNMNIFLFLVCGIGFKSFIFDICMVPSCSMTPSAQTGDWVLINRMAYGINRNSIQCIGGYLPFFKSKWFYRAPKRGETVIFTLPRDPQTIYFKRILGLPGDTIYRKNGILYINDEPVQMDEIGPHEVLSDDGSHIEKGIKYKITLPDGTSFFIFRSKKFGEGCTDNTHKYTVPIGHIWCLGDNNTGSQDCFYPDFIGESGVPIDNIIGKPILTLLGSNSRQKTDPHWIAWFIGLPMRIIVYTINLDINRFFKKFN